METIIDYLPQNTREALRTAMRLINEEFHNRAFLIENTRMTHITAHPKIADFRLSRHHLASHDPANLITVCQNVCGMQAQVMAAAELQFWARMHDLNRSEIHTALWESRTLVENDLCRN